MTITIMKTEDQFADIHRNYGGSSFSGALFDRGYADMPSAWSVWAFLSGKLDDLGPDEDENNRVRIGKAIEPVIAGECAFKMGWDLIEGWDYHADSIEDITVSVFRERIFVHHPDPDLKIGCTVDRYVREHEDGPGIVECKNRDYLQWIDAYTDDDASIRDRIQLAHQMACHPEITWGAIAALVGGNDLKVYRYKRADLEDMIADIEARWRILFGKVASQEEPSLSAGELPNWLKVHDEALGETPDVLTITDDAFYDGETFDAAVQRYLDANGRRKADEKIEKALKPRIVQHLDEHRFARSNRFKVRATYSKIKPTILTPSSGFMKALLLALGVAGDAGDAETCEVINTIIKEGGIKTRNGHTKVTLKFDDDPMTTQTGGKSNGPSRSDLKRAMDAQAPLDQKQ